MPLRARDNIPRVKAERNKLVFILLVKVEGQAGHERIVGGKQLRSGVAVRQNADASVRGGKNLNDKKVREELNVLINYGLLYKNEAGKKKYISDISLILSTDVLWIDKQRYFDLLFRLFTVKSKDLGLSALKELSFMDNAGRIKSRVKKDVKDLFFKDKVKYILYSKSEIDCLQNKAHLELYNRLDNGLRDIVDIEERSNIYEQICRRFFYSSVSDANKTYRRVYSLEVDGYANYVIQRRGGVYQALRSNSIATPTYLIDGKLVSIKYYSRRAIPYRINELINLLEYKDLSLQRIYRKEILDMGSVDKDAGNYIRSIHYTFSEKGKVRINAVLNKSAFVDIDISNLKDNCNYHVQDEAIKDVVNNYINNKNLSIYRYMSKPRKDGKSICVIKNSHDTLILAYPKEINQGFVEVLEYCQ